MKRFRRSSLLFLCLLSAAMPLISTSGICGNISTDGTLGPPTALDGPDYAVTAALGKQFGGNLFHSFSKFTVDTGESATFTGPSSVVHIISRVTGGEQSWIDGLIRSEIPGADMYLLNPAGLLFGPNATLDVAGSFHASTADYLRLGEEGRFDAGQPEMSSFSSAPPSAFGFSTPSPSGIGLDGSSLEVPEGKTLSVIGGDIRMHNASLVAPGGRINLASAAGAGEIRPVESGIDMNGVEKSGAVSISRDADSRKDENGDYYTDANVSSAEEGHDGGAIYIRSGRFEIRGGIIAADNEGENKAGGVDIRVTGNMTVDEGGWIQSIAYGTGDAGDVTITAGNLAFQNGAGVTTRTEGSGKGGNLAVNVQKSITISGENEEAYSGLYANTVEGYGTGGNITLSAAEIRIDDQGRIEAKSKGEGNAGLIDVTVDALAMTRGGQILTDTSGAGTGGNIIIKGKTLTLSGENAEALTGIYADTLKENGQGGQIDISVSTVEIGQYGRIGARAFGNGNAGSVTLNADNILLSGDSWISGTTLGKGNSADIVISATNQLSLQDDAWIKADAEGEGHAGNIRIIAPEVNLQDTAWITSDTKGNGMGGTMAISAQHMDLSGNSLIRTNSKGPGSGGNITLSASETLRIGENAKISANTSSTGTGGSISLAAKTLSVENSGKIEAKTTGAGNAGIIDVTIDSLAMTGSGQILTDTSGAGTGGDIVIKGKTLTLSGENADVLTGIYADTLRQNGQGGQIDISVSTLELGQYARITARAYDTGNAGGITLNADNIMLSGDGRISGTTFGKGNSADIVISAETSLSLQDYSWIAANTEGEGHAGNIHITAPKVSLQDTTYISSDTKGKGMGGDIQISTQNINLSDSSIIGARTSADGNAGEVTIDVAEMTMSGGSQIKTSTTGTGKGGNITLQATDSINIYGWPNGNRTSLIANTESTGEGGNIHITAPDLIVEDGGLISAEARAEGNSGKIEIHVDTLTLATGAWISGSTWFGKGDGGEITVHANERLQMSGPGEYSPGIYSSTYSGGGRGGKILIKAADIALDDNAYIGAYSTSDGPAGEIRLEGKTVSIKGGSLISAETSGTGSGGDIHISADDSLLISGTGTYNNSGLSTKTSGDIGQGGNIYITTPEFTLADTALIRADTLNDGHAGKIEIHVDTLGITTGAQISGSSWYGKGTGGDITVEASKSVRITGLDNNGFPAGFFSATYEGGGEGGNISIRSPNIDLDDYGCISVQSTGAGNAGEIDLLSDSATLSRNAFIIANSTGSGMGGDINLAVSRLNMNNQALISATSSGTGSGGQISYTGDDIRLANSSITAQTLQSDGGDMAFLTSTLLYLAGSQITTSVQGGSGNGGNIAITTPEFVVLDHGEIIANAYGGNGGNIAIVTDHFIPGTTGKVEASSRLGIAGQINIQAPDTDIGGGLAALPAYFLDAAALMKTPCDQRSRRNASSLILILQEGMSREPDDVFPSLFFQ